MRKRLRAARSRISIVAWVSRSSTSPGCSTKSLQASASRGSQAAKARAAAIGRAVFMSFTSFRVD
jgi:hypothetical protein